MLIVDYLILRGIHNRKLRAEKLKQLEQRRKFIPIASIDTGPVATIEKMNRGSSEDIENVIDVNPIDCRMKISLRYINNDRIRKLIISTYSFKKINGVIFIIPTAVCHIVMIMQHESPKSEWPMQVLTNPDCKVKQTKVPTIMHQSGLKYDDVVNMQDVTGIDTVLFSDIYISDLGQEKAISPSPKPGKGKMVSFLDRFGDPANIDESESWDMDTNSFENNFHELEGEMLFK